MRSGEALDAVTLGVVKGLSCSGKDTRDDWLVTVPVLLFPCERANRRSLAKKYSRKASPVSSEDCGRGLDAVVLVESVGVGRARWVASCMACCSR